MADNPFEDEVFEDGPVSIDYEGARFSTDEAEELIRWLDDPQGSPLFVRFLDHIRQASVDMMDGGLVTMANSEELMRQASMRKLILNIKLMAPALRGQLEAIAQANNDVE